MDNLRIGELFAKLKPRILDLINAVGGGAGPFAPTPHDLNSPHHTGSVGDNQAPQFLKIDGTRQLVGNLSVADNITIDGVDLSVFKSAYDTHAGLDAATAHGSVGIHSHQSNPQGGKLDHGLALEGLLDDDHTQYAHADGAGTRRAYEAARLNKSIIAGSGLTGGGLLTQDRTLSILLNSAWSGLSVDGNGLRVDTAASFTWTNDHTFRGITKTRHLQPELTDTYDLGTSTLLWRKGWLSELDAILFAQNTVTLLGGWLLITKDEGAIAADVGTTDTQIDFGKTMTPGDFVLFRAAGKVEYMQVGSLVSGTTYNVTRNLDGSGADAWPAGTPYAVLGQSGQGRIELNAYDTPRLQMIRQGATYNAQTELIRIGDLNGMFGISDNKYGIGIGQYGTNQNFLYYTPETGLVMRGRIYAEGGNISTFRETFDYNNINEFIARVSKLVGGTLTGNAWLETTSDSVAGGKVLKVGDNSGNDMLWIHIGQPIPYNPKKLYRMFVRVRRSAGSGTIYAGVAGVAADGVTLVNVIGNNDSSNQHYFCASAASPLSTWTEYIGYLSGTQTGGINGARPDPTNPLPLHQNARYFIPMILVNHSSQSGIYYIDEIRIDEITDTITADRIATSSLSVGTKLTIGQVADGKGRLELEANSDGTGTLKGIYRSGGIDTTHAYFGSDGKLYAGGGNVILDNNGLRLVGYSVDQTSSTSIKFGATSSVVDAAIYFTQDSNSTGLRLISENSFYEKMVQLGLFKGNDTSQISVLAESSSNTKTEIFLYSSLSDDYISFQIGSSYMTLYKQYNNAYGTVSLSSLTLNLTNLPSVANPDPYGNETTIFGYNRTIWIASKYATVPIGVSPPWLVAPEAVQFLYNSWNPIINLNYQMRDLGVPEGQRRLLTAQTAWTGHTIFGRDKTIANSLEYYGTNSTNQYFFNTSPLFVSADGFVFIMWFYPTSSGANRGLVQNGIPTVNFAAYITSNGKVVFEVFDTSNTQRQIISTNYVTYNAWNYIIYRYNRNSEMSLTLNGIKTGGGVPTLQLRAPSGDFRLGWSNYAGAMYGYLGWTACGLIWHPTDEIANWLIDISRAWHKGGA